MTNSCKNAVLNLAEKEACVLFFLVIKRIILQAILGSKQSPHFNQNTRPPLFPLPSFLLSIILHQPLPGSASSFCQLRLQVRTCRKSGALSSLSLLFCLHSSFTSRIHEAALPYMIDTGRVSLRPRPIVRCQGKSPLIRFRTCVGKRLRQKNPTPDNLSNGHVF